MQSDFDTSRIFNDQDGWYVIMRESDNQHLTSSMHKLIGNQHLIGPFEAKHQVEIWLEGYLAMHAENRLTYSTQPDSVSICH
jgi:hypothetical protein